MKAEVVSQYKAALTMLGNVIKKCPDGLWEDDSYENPYWRITYHTLHYSALYLAGSVEEFTPWAKQIANYHSLGTVIQNGAPVVIYTKTEMLDYADVIIGNLEHLVSEDRFAAYCGFDWLTMNRLQLHLYNTRHIQHHVGQLTERLQRNGIWGLNWVS